MFSASENDRCAGVAIMSATPDCEILDPIFDPEGKIMAANLKTRGDIIRIINLHLPTSPTSDTFDPALLKLHQIIQSPYRKIVAGDFNFVEDPRVDRLPPQPLGHENSHVLEQWKRFRDDYQLQDIAENDRPTKFTREMQNWFSRIDRFYTSPGIKSQNRQVKHVPLSDHRLVLADFILDPRKKVGKGRFKCNAKVHERPDFLLEVQEKVITSMDQPLYSADPSRWWTTLKKDLAKIYRKHAILRTRETQQQQKDLEIAIGQAENRLAQNPYTERLKQQFQNAKTRYRDFILNKTKEKMIKQRYNNYGKHYFQTKEFFRQFKQKQKDSIISEMVETIGDAEVTHTTAEGILKVAQKFFTKLYKREQTDREKQDFFLDFVQPKLSQDQNDFLNRPITEEEVLKAIMDTKAGGSPGFDGLSIDFYKTFADIIKKPLAHVLNKFYQSSNIPYDVKISVITVMHKKGDRNKIQNYRPISLCNNDLKILTKIMCERVQKFMDQFIEPDQFACPGRNISTPNHILRDIYQDARQRGQQHFILSVDFIKAFDSVDRKFMIKVLEKMGFEGRFLEMVKNLNSGVGAKAMINRFLTKTIKLKRGIKQGDALSMFLFIITIQPLLLAIQQLAAIEGIPVPGGKKQKKICYADDLNALLKNSASIRPLMDLLEKFGLASGLKVHPTGDKRCSVLSTIPGLINTAPQDIPENVQWAQGGMEILGTAYGEESYTANFTENKIEEMKGEAERIRQASQSFADRTQIGNQKLIPIATFHAQFHGLSNNETKKIDNIARKFCLGSSQTLEKYELSTRDQDHGGAGLPHFSKITESMILKQVFKYVQTRMLGQELDVEMSLFHSNLGQFISRLCGLPAYRPIRMVREKNYFYKRIQNFINFYQITKDEILAGALKPIRARIRNGNSKPTNQRGWGPPFEPSPQKPPNEIHNPILSNTAKTFNYERIENLLQFPSIHAFGPRGSPGNCAFCATAREIPKHLFRECPHTDEIWRVLGNALGSHFRTDEIDLMRFASDAPKKLAKTLIISTTTYKIWKTRKKLKEGTRPGLFDKNILLKTLDAGFQDDLRFQRSHSRNNQNFLSDFQSFCINYRIFLGRQGLLMN